ncbi:DUF881 domain-containing protein [Nocardioides bizhenqiangii]|uniref:DUF881 domain-containing protein n=1 Tax=Nocardioides bizhenqiangii TaxID=3095076 RepID=A0ABZ0ZL73_9ACTN|nr:MULTISPECIES: DUF881 domain-containing protein [unclassified Nocardioides]MDZ5620134.1 DUF881 domain-containing protein [Nocardioides sp. HM23]MDZ5623457.1 DUF881 domain-containing protein [Nocardioides sp. HM23]WQQ24511.1 DUF881 domain-containing protein [Nocardioides sp. HM61]
MPDDPDATPPADPAPSPDDGPRQRIITGLRTPSRSQIVVGLLLGVLGFAAVTQVRVNETDDTFSGLREQELIDILSALAGTRQRAEDEIEELEDTRDQLRNDTSRRQAALDQAQEDVDELNILAGLVPVTGPGIRITIVEETGRVSLSSLLDTIQELRTVGAEAMQLNGTVRIVAETSFEETEGGFLVDGELVEAPYVLDVIGEPSVLAPALEFLLGPKAQLMEDGATLEVDELTSIDIEAVHEPDDPDFSAPDPDE